MPVTLFNNTRCNLLVVIFLIMFGQARGETMFFTLRECQLALQIRFSFIWNKTKHTTKKKTHFNGIYSVLVTKQRKVLTLNVLRQVYVIYLSFHSNLLSDERDPATPPPNQSWNTQKTFSFRVPQCFHNFAVRERVVGHQEVSLFLSRVVVSWHNSYKSPIAH